MCHSIFQEKLLKLLIRRNQILPFKTQHLTHFCTKYYLFFSRAQLKFDGVEITFVLQCSCTQLFSLTPQPQPPTLNPPSYHCFTEHRSLLGVFQVIAFHYRMTSSYLPVSLFVVQLRVYIFNANVT